LLGFPPPPPPLSQLLSLILADPLLILADPHLLTLDRLEKNAQSLHKEAKAYLDAVRSVSASSTRIGTTLDLFFGSDAGEAAMSANAYKRAVEEMEGNIARSIVCSSFPFCDEKGADADRKEGYRTLRIELPCWNRLGNSTLIYPKLETQLPRGRKR